MKNLLTIFSSNIPVDCHILKGRLLTDGIDCFIFDEHIIWVHPFKAVAIGGVKLKVASNQYNLALEIMNNKSDWTPSMEIEQERQNEILRIRTLIRENSGQTATISNINSDILNLNEISELNKNEKEFKSLSEKRLNFNWKQFWYELFDPDRNVFEYLRIRPAKYYIENDLVNNYRSIIETDSNVCCPNCKSANIRFGHAIDYKLDILYLILSVLIFTPFPPFRKNYFCYNCGLSFSKKRAATRTA